MNDPDARVAGDISELSLAGCDEDSEVEVSSVVDGFIKSAFSLAQLSRSAINLHVSFLPGVISILGDIGVSKMTRNDPLIPRQAVQ